MSMRTRITTKLIQAVCQHSRDHSQDHEMRSKTTLSYEERNVQRTMAETPEASQTIAGSYQVDDEEKTQTTYIQGNSQNGQECSQTQTYIHIPSENAAAAEYCRPG